MERRIITELGAGADLHGRDQTKAAIRAVEDAMRHSSLSIFRSLDLDPRTMRVEILIGAPKPDEVDAEAVAATLPYGRKEVTVVAGGVTSDGLGGPNDTIVCSAAVTAFVELPEDAWRLARDE